MADPERMWLEPACADDQPEGRCYSTAPLDDCDEEGCGLPAVEYVRADILEACAKDLEAALREIQGLEAEVEHHRIDAEQTRGRANALEAHLAALEADLAEWRNTPPITSHRPQGARVMASDLETVRAYIEAREAEVARHLRTVETLEANLADLEAKMAAEEARIRDLEAEVERLLEVLGRGTP